MIIYFSGTGNSKYVAEKIAYHIGDEILSVSDRLKTRTYEKIYSDKPIVIVAPIYAWRIPKVMEDYIKTCGLYENKNVHFIVTTCGTSGNASKYARIFCEQLNCTFMGLTTIHMAGSYIAFMESPTKADSILRIQRAQPIISDCARYIKENQKFPQEHITSFGRFMSYFANPFFYRHSIGKRGFYTTDACIGCKKCEKVCMLNNVKVEKGKPVWGDECTHCMACICRCPKEAIEYRKRSQGRMRYYLEKVVDE